MLAAIAQVFYFLPFKVEDMFADKIDGTGIEWWYNEAIKISRENEKSAKRKN